MPPKKPAAQPELEATATAAATATATATGNQTHTGVLDVAATGDGGAREEEVGQATQELARLGAEVDLGDEAGAIVAELTAAILEQFKHRPKPWGAMSQTEQRDLSAVVEDNSKTLVRLVVEAVARNGREAIRCLHIGFTDKGEDIKVELKVKAHTQEELESAVLGLHRARGKVVLLTVATADDYHEVPASDESEPEQSALGFEAGSDEHPDDDSDLVEAAETPEGDFDPSSDAVVHTGDRLVIARHGLCEARINLKSGMLEALPPGEDSETGWIDVREARPDELAAQRENAADFVEG